jgi:poly(ribitol-phosphate) beta-N-acetylglucosaminyltransferase
VGLRARSGGAAGLLEVPDQQPKVSVVVPVYNPGHDIDDCIRTLLDQSLPAGEYEVIFVDDGSTDGTSARLDAIAAAHPHVRVQHIPNSGWPGRPRNLGMDLARGEYVYFCDNDDWLGHEALERMHAMAVRDDADIVIGKVVGHGKSVPRNLFRRNRTGVGLDWEPLVWLLTPHKLFRRSFLDAHGLRYPEGRRRLEDHVFVMRAYFQSPRISVLADYPCYHWVLRDRDTNASWGHLDPRSYFAFMSEVLDVIDEHTEPGPFRDRLYARWYRGKMLNRVEKVHSNPDLAHRRALYLAMHELAAERFPPGVDEFLPFNLQLRSHLLRAGAYTELESLAEFESALRAQARAIAVRPAEGGVELEVEAELEGLRFNRGGGRVTWNGDDTDASAALGASTVQLLLKRRETQEEYRVRATVDRRLEDDADGRVRAPVAVKGRVDGATAAAGAPLPAGMWEVHAMVIVAGFRAATRVRRVRGSEHLMLAAGPDGRVAERRPGWQRNMRRRMPRAVVAALRRAERAVVRRVRR